MRSRFAWPPEHRWCGRQVLICECNGQWMVQIDVNDPAGGLTQEYADVLRLAVEVVRQIRFRKSGLLPLWIAGVLALVRYGDPRPAAERVRDGCFEGLHDAHEPRVAAPS